MIPREPALVSHAEEVGLRDDDYLHGLSICALKDKLYQKARGGPRAVRELDNAINLRWYHGEPWFRRSPETNRAVGLAPDQRQRYVHVNKLFEICRAIEGVLFYEPSVEPHPKSVDAGDVGRATMAADLGNAICHSGGLAKAYRRVLGLNNLCGLGYIKVAWDPAAGGRRPVFGQVVCPVCRGSGVVQGVLGVAPCWNCATQGLVPGEQGWRGAGRVDQYLNDEPEGDVTFTAVHMDDVFVDPEADTVDDGDDVLHRIKMSRHRAWRMYGRGLGVSEEYFVGEEGADDTQSFSMRLSPGMPTPTDDEYVRVYEYYHRPTEDYPDGVFGVTIGNKELVAGRLPYVNDREPFPLFSFPMYEVMGMQYPLGTADLVLPLAIAYNDHVTTLYTRAKLTSRLRFKVPRTTAFEVDDKNGNVYYTPTPRGDAPQELQLSSAPSDLGSIITVLGDAIETVSGAVDVVRGRMQGEQSARAMAFVEERAIGPLKPVIADHARRLDRVVKYGVDIARLFYDDGRMMRIPGETGGFQVREFRVENIGESTDVALVTVRDIGRSRATLMAELNEAADRQMVDQETYTRLAEFGDTGALHKERKLHRDQAAMEEQLLVRNGSMPSPGKYQNHVIHLHSHQQKLVGLQTTDPNHPAIAPLLQHMEWTKQIESQERVEQQMMDQQNAAAYGMANAAGQPAAQSAQEAQAPVSGATEPYNAIEPGAPETQGALDQIDQQTAQLADSQEGY